jgi:allantoinase
MPRNQNERVSRVMAIAVHPFVTGQPHRVGALDAALEYICSLAGVWRATGWEIVQHFLAQQSK